MKIADMNYRCLVCIFLLFIAGIDLFGFGYTFDDRTISIPENVEVRREYRDIIEAQELIVVQEPVRIIEQTGEGTSVQFMVQRQNGHFYLIFANERNGTYPLAGTGTYIIKRSQIDGTLVQAQAQALVSLS